MLTPFAQRTTERASPRRVSGIDVLNGNPHGLSLVLDKGLQLPESPSVQVGFDSLATFDVVSNVGQIFKDNLTHFKEFGFFNNRFTHFVVRVFYSPLLFTRDVSERLFCALTAVGLQATTERKMFITSMPKFATTKKFTRACGDKIIFSNIDTQNGFRFNGFNFWKFKNQVEKPVAILEDKFSFLRGTLLQQIGLMLPIYPFNFDSTSEGIERKKVFLKRVRPFIKVNRSSTKVNFWNKIFFDLPQRFLGLIGFTDTKNCVAAHLRTKRSVSPKVSVSKVVQGYSVPTSICNHDGNQRIASSRVSGTKFTQGYRLFMSGSQFKGNSFQHLPSLGYMFRAFNIFFNCVCAYMSRRSNVVGRRPQMSSPQPFFKHRESHKQPSACSSLKHLDGIRDSNRRGNTQKQMDVVRLNFTSQHLPFSFSTNLVQKFFKGFGNFTAQNIMPILRTPYNVISGLIHTISICGYVFHSPHSKPCDAASQAAIPPLNKFRGFLAEVL